MELASNTTMLNNCRGFESHPPRSSIVEVAQFGRALFYCIPRFQEFLPRVQPSSSLRGRKGRNLSATRSGGFAEEAWPLHGGFSTPPATAPGSSGQPFQGAVPQKLNSNPSDQRLGQSPALFGRANSVSGSLRHRFHGNAAQHPLLPLCGGAQNWSASHTLLVVDSNSTRPSPGALAQMAERYD